MQVLDDGRLTDGQGRTVDFKNTILILTSNIGSHHYADPFSSDATFESTKDKIMDDVRSHFRPEFINRLDDIVVFRMLGMNNIREIVRIMLKTLIARLAEKKITVRLSDEAELHLATTGFDPMYGARPLKRAIQRDLMNELAKRILAGDVRDGTSVLVNYRDGHYVFTEESSLAPQS
ncbi:MAG: AAA family ATPase [Armatimonadetes bacterium]|nr:AAA family ATPase [Armatimonadota bacterium]